MGHVGQTRRKEKMMSESKITATKVARLGVWVLAFLAALVAVQAFGAKPAEASLLPGPSVVVRVLEELDGAAPPAVDLEHAQVEAYGATWMNAEALREAEKQAMWTDDPGELVTDTEVAKRKEALKSKIEDSIEYVHDGGCAIAEFAAETRGLPPTDDYVRDIVETALPEEVPVEIEEGSSGSDLVKRKQVKSELVEINHLVRRDMKVSYSNGEPDVDVASEILSGAIDAGCKMKDAIKSFRQ
jgi:hypothetical protein